MKKITQITKTIIIGLTVVAILGGNVRPMKIDPPGNLVGATMPRVTMSIDPPGN